MHGVLNAASGPRACGLPWFLFFFGGGWFGGVFLRGGLNEYPFCLAIEQDYALIKGGRIPDHAMHFVL